MSHLVLLAVLVSIAVTGLLTFVLWRINSPTARQGRRGDGGPAVEGEFSMGRRADDGGADGGGDGGD